MNTSRNLNKSENKLIGLELVRFISALAILIWHYQHFFFIKDSPINFTRELQPFYSIFEIFYNYGLFGVRIFWCVSGFIFFWKYGDLIADKFISGKKFILLRFSRLYPLHFLTLLIVAFFQIIYFNENGFFLVYQFNDFYHFFLQLFFISDWGFENGYSFNGVIWSISVEIMVYIFFFLTLRYVAFSNSLKINFFIIFISLFILFTDYLNFPVVMDVLCLFYSGGIAAIIYSRYRNSKLLLYIMFILFFAIPLIIYQFEFYNFKHWLTVIMIIYTPICLFLFSKIIINNYLLVSILKVFGNMTYSSYLIHFPLQFLIILIFSYAGVDIPFYNNLFFITYLFLTLALSYFAYYFFEKPVQNKLRKYFLI
jgi:peptidoglycan/LPS O-acetylase OafA/YrhL